MMTVHEVSKLTGVSIRRLHYYDQIGLLRPSDITESGYRLYNDVAIERLQQILLFRELEFPLKEIKQIIDSKTFEKEKALEQQIELLILKKERLESLITFAREIKLSGGKEMDFSAFDTKKIDDYKKQAKEQWGNTNAYKEFQEKDKNRTKEDNQMIAQGLMDQFVEIGKLIDQTPESDSVQEKVKLLQDYITNNYYTCTNEIFAGLGQMYGAGGEFTENINKVAGAGCAEFTAKAIEYYCMSK